MPIDFNAAEEQRDPIHGPVPAGSLVLLHLEILKPKNESQRMPFVAVSQKKLYMLWVRLTVHSGSYQGFKWTENWMLPECSQQVQLTEKQKLACRISYSRMRGVIEAAWGISPKDKSPQANSRRKINDWLDLNGLVFPARVVVADDGREYNGRTIWDNQIARIITPEMEEYQKLMAGGEFINPKGETFGKNAPKSNRQEPPIDDYDDYGYRDYDSAAFHDAPPSDDCPF